MLIFIFVVPDFFDLGRVGLFVGVALWQWRIVTYCYLYANVIFDFFQTDPLPSRPISDSRAYMTAVLNSMIIGAWGAVEVCLLTLWRDAVNEYPEYLAELIGGPNRMDSYIAARNQGIKWVSPSDRQVTNPATAHASIQDPATTLLDDFKSTKVGFSSLKTIRMTYSKSFAKDFSAIDASLCDPCKRFLWFAVAFHGMRELTASVSDSQRGTGCQTVT